VKVRAGLHVGQVHVLEGDAFGLMVNFTARVVGRVPGAEVLVSDRAHGDILEEGAGRHRELRWVKHPACELKGFAGTHTVWPAHRGPAEEACFGPLAPAAPRR
jgi:class 3 adenylate cyclase